MLREWLSGKGLVYVFDTDDITLEAVCYDDYVNLYDTKSELFDWCCISRSIAEDDRFNHCVNWYNVYKDNAYFLENKFACVIGNFKMNIWWNGMCIEGACASVGGIMLTPSACIHISGGILKVSLLTINNEVAILDVNTRNGVKMSWNKFKKTCILGK